MEKWADQRKLLHFACSRKEVAHFKLSNRQNSNNVNHHLLKSMHKYHLNTQFCFFTSILCCFSALTCGVMQVYVWDLWFMKRGRACQRKHKCFLSSLWNPCCLVCSKLTNDNGKDGSYFSLAAQPQVTTAHHQLQQKQSSSITVVLCVPRAESSQIKASVVERRRHSADQNTAERLRFSSYLCECVCVHCSVSAGRALNPACFFGFRLGLAAAFANICLPLPLWHWQSCSN